MKLFYQKRHDDIGKLLSYSGSRDDRKSLMDRFPCYQKWLEFFMDDWNRSSFYDKRRRLEGKVNRKDISFRYFLRDLMREYRAEKLLLSIR